MGRAQVPRTASCSFFPEREEMGGAEWIIYLFVFLIDSSCSTDKSYDVLGDEEEGQAGETDKYRLPVPLRGFARGIRTENKGRKKRVFRNLLTP